MLTLPRPETVRLTALVLVLAAGAVSAALFDDGPLEAPGSDVEVRSHVVGQDPAASHDQRRLAGNVVPASATLPDHVQPIAH